MLKVIVSGRPGEGKSIVAEIIYRALIDAGVSVTMDYIGQEFLKEEQEFTSSRFDSILEEFKKREPNVVIQQIQEYRASSYN